MKKVIFLFVILFFIGCAGRKTESFVLDLPPVPQVKTTLGLHLFEPEKPLNVAEEHRGSVLGTLEKPELIQLNHSLYATLMSNNVFQKIKPLTNASDPNVRFKLLWMPRNYTIWAGGSQIKGVACVTFCFVNSKGKVVYQEEFSVSGEAFHSSIGSMKQKLNEAIVNRITVKTINLFQRKKGQRLAMSAVYNDINYHKDFNSAAQVLPDEMLRIKLASRYRVPKNWKLQFGMDEKIKWQKFVDAM